MATTKTPASKKSAKTAKTLIQLRAEVDRFVELNSTIKSLSTERDEIKSDFINSGYDVIPNMLETTQANIIRVAGRKTVDWEAVARELGAPQALIDAHTSVADGYAKVTITSPKQ